MADIDKALPNVEQTINIPPEEEIIAHQETGVTQVSPDDVKVEEQDDGSVEINFNPNAVNQPGGEGHFDNLADLLPDDVLGRLGSELNENFSQYKNSRKDQETGVTQVSPDDVKVEEQDDGSVEINFNPNAVNQPGGEGHFDNLADLLPDDILGRLGSELNENFSQYKNSRKDWEDTYTRGLDLLGFKYENPTQPFQGASGATHPVLAEAVTQFQAQAYKELLPATGPVHTQIMGRPDRQKEDQSVRVKNFMNYQLMDVMKEYEPEFDQMLFYLPLAGSAFKKVYYDELLGRAVSKFVPADDLVVPYTATS